MSIRNFLPAEIHLDDVWSSNISNLYDVFCETFVHDPVTFNGKPVSHDSRKKFDDLEEGFWHVVSRDPIDKKTRDGRLPDYPRARRIGWIRPILENYQCPDICAFKYLEGSGNYRIYLWLLELDHLVILEELKDSYKMITSFRITNVWVEDDLRKKLRRKLPI